MNFDKTLISVDVESTGVDPATDRIVQIAVVKYDPAKNCAEQFTRLIQPQISIPEEVTEVHGITDAMVKDKPLFKQIVSELCAFMEDAEIIIGYNLFRFDILIIQQELRRAGYKFDFPMEGSLVIDAGNIFQKKEKRTLEAAVEKYCGRKHEKAHNATADATATYDVLQGQLAAYADLSAMPIEELANFSQMEDMVDYAGKLARNKNGDVIYRIGKAKGMRVIDDPGFGEWMLRQIWVTEDTRKHLVAAMSQDDDPTFDDDDSDGDDSDDDDIDV